MTNFKKPRSTKPINSTENVSTPSWQTLFAIAGAFGTIAVTAISIFLYLTNQFSAIQAAIHQLDLKYEARMTKIETQMEERNNKADK